MGGGTDGIGHITSEGFVVNANWNSDDSKWNFNANPLDGNVWNAGNRVFSYCTYFSSLLWGVFNFQPLSPPTKHSSNFL